MNTEQVQRAVRDMFLYTTYNAVLLKYMIECKIGSLEDLNKRQNMTYLFTFCKHRGMPSTQAFLT